MSLRAVSRALVVLSLASPAPLAGQQPITIGSLTEIEHPLLPAWSPDGTRIAFVRDRAGVQNVAVVDAAGGEPRTLTSFEDAEVDGRWIEDGPIADLFWAGETVYFVRAGELWRADASGTGEPERAWPGVGPASGYALSPDGTRLAYLKAGDIHVRPLTPAGGERRLVATPDAEGSLAWSPDGAWIAFTAARPAEVVVQTPAWNGDKLHFSRVRRGEPRVGVVRVEDGRVWTPAGGAGPESSPRWLDADRLAFQRVTADLAARELLVADVPGRSVEVLHRDDGDGWWSLTHVDAGPHPSPDGRWVAFLSDRDGWDHLWLVAADGGEPVRVTRGDFEVRGVAWSPDGGRLAFSTNRGENPGVRRVEVIRVGSAGVEGEPEARTPARGTATSPIWSPDGSRLVVQRTTPQHPADLYAVAAGGDPEATRLTVSLPPALREVDFVEPEFVTYPAPDGSPVPAWLYVPDGAREGESRPAIVWIHGDGVNQNYDGWHVQRNYAVYSSVHQYLLRQGYVVLAVDYRGSIGYGREWREAHRRDLGGGDYRDVAAGVEYLEGLGFVDAGRVGVWGLSYGGFLTLQALTVTPELFACGIDVAGVQDWRDWYRDPGGRWIHGRMGAPWENPELYERTAPIHRVDRIVRPVAVLHGTADVNVPFLESARLVDRLQKHGVPVDFEMYPGEFHYLHRAHVLEAAWRRVDAFFDSCLAPPEG